MFKDELKFTCLETENESFFQVRLKNCILETEVDWMWFVSTVFLNTQIIMYNSYWTVIFNHNL